MNDDVAFQTHDVPARETGPVFTRSQWLTYIQCHQPVVMLFFSFFLLNSEMLL